MVAAASLSVSEASPHDKSRRFQAQIEAHCASEETQGDGAVRRAGRLISWQSVRIVDGMVSHFGRFFHIQASVGFLS